MCREEPSPQPHSHSSLSALLPPPLPLSSPRIYRTITPSYFLVSAILLQVSNDRFSRRHQLSEAYYYRHWVPVRPPVTLFLHSNNHFQDDNISSAMLLPCYALIKLYKSLSSSKVKNSDTKLKLKVTTRTSRTWSTNSERTKRTVRWFSQASYMYARCSETRILNKKTEEVMAENLKYMYNKGEFGPDQAYPSILSGLRWVEKWVKWIYP